MFAAVIIVHVLASLALILIVLLQAGKGTGIANVFGGAGQTVFGARTGDVLARGTEVCAGLFMLTSLSLAMMSSDRASSVMRKGPLTQEQPAVPASPMQQAMVEKMKQAVAGIAQTVKQAAQTATQTKDVAKAVETAPPAAQPSATPAPSTGQEAPKPADSPNKPANP